MEEMKVFLDSNIIFSRMDFFITGNTRDFKHLYHKKILKTTVLTPGDFLNREKE